MKMGRRLSAFSGSVLVGSALVLAAPATDAAVYTPGNTTTMTINAVGASTPASTTVNVYGTATTITDVNVVLTGLSHTFPDDVDIELVHTSSLFSTVAVALMSDVCGASDLTSATMTLDDQAATAMPDATSCSTGTYRPTNVDNTDSFAVPPVGASLSAFNGATATGQWSLYIQDDTGGNAGSLVGWSLQITTTADAAMVFPGPQSTNGSGPAGPYPYPIPVSGMTGPVSDVNLTLPGLTHTEPADLDVMLVSPSGQHVVVMSDGCGNTASDVTLVFDDQAAGDAPSINGLCTSGSYRPRNYGTGDQFPDPAGSAPLGTTMAAFNGGTANGSWLLYVVDDTASFDTGWLLGAPTLTITTDDEAPDTKIKKRPHTTRATTAKLKFTSTEPGSSFECKVDHKKWQRCAAKLKLKHLKAGKHRVQVRATDAVGNTDPTPAKATWRVLRRR